MLGCVWCGCVCQYVYGSGGECIYVYGEGVFVCECVWGVIRTRDFISPKTLFVCSV